MVMNQEPRQVKLIDFGRAVVLKRKNQMKEFTADGDEFVPSA